MKKNMHKKALCISMMCLLATGSISGCAQKTSIDSDVLGYQGVVDIENESNEIVETVNAADLINESDDINDITPEAEEQKETNTMTISETPSLSEDLIESGALESEEESEETVKNQETEGSQEETKSEETTESESAIKGLTAVAQVEKYVNVRTEPNSESGIVGKIYNNCAATILDEVDCVDGKWYYMESGNVTGYIKAEFFVTGEAAEALRKEVGNTFGTVIVENLRVRSTPDLSDESNIISMMPMGTDVYIIEHDDSWAKIQTDAVNIGYVHVSCLKLRTEFETAISLAEEEKKIQEKKEAEEKARQAEEEYKALIAKQEQESIDASIAASIEESYLAQSRAEAEQAAQQPAPETPAPAPETPAPAPETPAPAPETPAPVPETPAAVPETPAVSQTDVNAALRNAIVAFAVQYEGCPYVHGGNSLDHGTDCSGFTKLIYQNFGYTLDRTPGGQSVQGRRIANSEIKPGDLVFYTRDTGAIGHVALYIGDGKIIHACNEKYGICIWDMYYREPAWCVTIIG